MLACKYLLAAAISVYMDSERDPPGIPTEPRQDERPKEIMKILFCDLCNESVPQSELDAGRAFMRKGRVVCGRCDELMTQRESGGHVPAAGAAGPMGTPFIEPVPQASLTPAPGAFAQTGAGHGAFGGAHAPHSGGHGGHGHHARPQRSGSGVAVALFALALGAGGFYWLLERSERVNGELQARIESLRVAQDSADMRAMERSTELRSELLAMQGRFDTAVEAERRTVEVGLLESQQKAALVQASVADLRAAVDEFKVVLPSLQRHEQELIATGRRFSEIESRANALDGNLSDLKKIVDQRAITLEGAGGGGNGAGEPAPVGMPPWMGLVQQLESAQSGDRWVAVTSLGETRDPAVAEYILPRLKDVDIFVRMVAARVLGDLGSQKAIGALIEALGDQDAAVREAAYVALCAVSKKNLPFEPHQDPNERAKKVKAWQEWWKKAQEEGASQ